MFLRPRLILRTALATAFIFSLIFYAGYTYSDVFSLSSPPRTYEYIPSSYDWSTHKLNFPIPREQMVSPPIGSAKALPPVQRPWSKGEALMQARSREHMAESIRVAFQKTYASYESLAFGHDEVTPLTRQPKDTFNGWGATIVDSMDTLWIMGFKEEWERAVEFVARLDWDKPSGETCNLFETGIRFLGGLIAAYDLSGESVLLQKAVELADMMYAAWDNELHLPRGRFTWEELKAGKVEPLAGQSMAGIGSFTMEFARLSIITGDPKYYDAVDRISRHFARTQNITQLPGLWPVHVNALQNFSVDAGNSFHYGASADSAYEYFPKMHALLGGQEPLYEQLYRTSTDVGIKNLVYRPMLPDGDNVLFMGEMTSHRPKDSSTQTTTYTFTPAMNHLTCFVGGMFLLGGKLTNNERDVHVGEKLALGCASAYRLVSPAHIMPEQAKFLRCESLETCPWDETLWHQIAAPGAPRGFAEVGEPKYILRPEAIESIFYLWRVTGDTRLQMIAEDMWTAITRACEGGTAFASIKDITQSSVERVDSMESFFLAETLKYFYLIFANPLVMNLDEWVFNTEAHPFKRELPSTAP